MKAVILAAGRGERLGVYTSLQPKPLVKLYKQSMIEHVITSCKKAGITDFLVVTGYKGELIQRKLGEGKTLGVKIKYVSNPKWQNGNFTSLFAAEKNLLDEPYFILTMSDHLYNEALITNALKSYNDQPTICVDKNPVHVKDLEDATKVRVRHDGSVQDIGKEIRKYNCIDTGVFIMPSDVFKFIDGVDGELYHFMKILIKAKNLVACDVTGVPWIDVDTPQDLEYARKVAPLWT
jgi:choline kinase